MIDSNSKIGDIVVSDFRSATVFKKYGLDFCCGGGKMLETACQEKSIDVSEVLADLEIISGKESLEKEQFSNWPLDQLIDHIVEEHHGYVKRAIGDLEQYLGKVVKVHGQHNPELHAILENFNLIRMELLAHMQKEEMVLFPYIKKMVASRKDGVSLPPPMFGAVQNPIQLMEEEHEEAGGLMKKINSLSSNYTPPEHACNTYMVSFKLLEEFENDLHMHIHLENNILFPKAIVMEKELLS